MALESLAVLLPTRVEGIIPLCRKDEENSEGGQAVG